MTKKNKKDKIRISVRKFTKNRKKNKQDKPDFLTQVILTLFIFLSLFMAYSVLSKYTKTDKMKELTLSQLAEDVKSGAVNEIAIRGERVEAIYNTNNTKEPLVKETKKEKEASLTETLVNYGITPDQLSHVKIEVKDPSGFKYWFWQIAPMVIPALLLFGIIMYMTRQTGKGGHGMQPFTFGMSRARLRDPDDDKDRVTFDDVAGSEEAKDELTEIVDFLKSPKKYIKIGAKIPKGVLLMGAPGCGKTLLARAVAGEARVPFYSIAGSEFVDMFVGVGASRTRDLFAQAKKNAPSIIFIDEIDAVGRVRGGGVGGGNDEREQTLNQILVEMDGFEPNAKVIVMAATNRPDVLDPALLRPGRFDRRVIVELPDRKARQAILTIHIKNKRMDDDINLKTIAKRTPGFSGADLANLANEAAILAATNDRTKVTQDDLLDSIEKVMIGPERKSHVLDKREKEVTAYHEAGHALVASMLPYSDPVHKISIISRGRAAGYTLKLPDKDRRMQSKKEFQADIAMALGGYIAEKMVFGDITTGPSNDLQVLTNTARNMVTRWGMSDEVGPIALVGDGGEVMFGSGPHAKEYSETVNTKIDSEVKKIIDSAYNVASEILTKNRSVLDAIVKKLLEVENLEREDYETILKENGITLQKREDMGTKS